MDIKSTNFFQGTRELWLNGHGTVHQEIIFSGALLENDAQKLAAEINRYDPQIQATHYEPNMGGGYHLVYMKRPEIFRGVFPDITLVPEFKNNKPRNPMRFPGVVLPRILTEKFEQAGL